MKTNCMADVLETRRLILRPRTLADTDDCLAMDREPEVTRYVVGPWEDPVAHRAFVEARTRGPWPSGHGYWTTRPRSGPAIFMGWALLLPVEGTEDEAEIGWRLKRQFWGQGFATEAARSVLEHAVRRLHLASIVADIHPDNTGSMKVARRIGMRREGAVQSHGAQAIRYALRASEITASPAG